MRENSVAREDSGVCFGESVMRRLVFSERRPTKDCGVMSGAYAAEWVSQERKDVLSDSLLVFGAKSTTWS